MEMNNLGTGQSYTAKDQELIRQLMESRKEQHMPLEFESLDGYELPPRSQFSMLKKPAVSIKYKTISCNTACIRLFPEIIHVIPIVHPQKRRLAIVPCIEEDASSVEWARHKDGDMVRKDITSLEFVEKIYALMNWDRNCRYKILGRVANSPSNLILLFDLDEAIFYSATATEYVNEETGEIKKRRTVYYPNEYKDHIGKSYNDYVEARQLSVYEYLEGYVGQTYEDAVDSSPAQTVTAPKNTPTAPAAPVEPTPSASVSGEPAPIVSAPIVPTPVEPTPAESVPVDSPAIVPQTTVQTDVPPMQPVPTQINPMEGASL